MDEKHGSMGAADSCRNAVGAGVKINNADNNPKNMKVLIGGYDFKTILKGGYYYGDKTLLIRDLIEHGPAPVMITRPRRSGKSLGLSVIDRFFNVAYAEEEAEEDSFAGLKIEQCSRYPHYAKEYRNRYPIVKLSFNSYKFDSAEEFEEHLRQYIAEVVEGNFEYLETSDKLSSRQKSKISRIMDGISGDIGLALQNVCNLLEIHHGLKPMLLIDEYDTPLTRSYGKPYWEKIAESYGSFLESVVKSNEHVSFVVITGVQRIVTNGMASGMNNVYHCGVMSDDFAEHFGLTPDEVEDAIRRQVDDLFPDWSEERRKEYADRKFAEAKEWYDGYRIGRCDIYNPWSVTNFIHNDIRNDNPPQPYWNGTSKNGILVEVLSGFGSTTLDRIKDLYQSKDIPEFDRIKPNSIVWNGGRLTENDVAPLLLSHGYLTADRTDGKVKVRVPNEEVREAYDDLMKLAYCLSIPDVIDLVKHIVQKDAGLVKQDLERLMSGGATIDGWKENRYRMWMRQLFELNGYKSIAEYPSGTGFIDMLVREHATNPPILFEYKVLDPEDRTDLSAALDEGVGQIVDRNYADEYRLPGVIPLAVAFRQKSCAVRFL